MGSRKVVVSPKLWRTLWAVRAVLAKDERQALDEIVRRGTGDDAYSGQAAGRRDQMAISFRKTSKNAKNSKNAQVTAHKFGKVGKNTKNAKNSKNAQVVAHKFGKVSKNTKNAKNSKSSRND